MLEQKDCKSLAYPKRARLRYRSEYQKISRVKKKLIGQYLVISYNINKALTGPKLGITVSKKYGKAHLRNRFKRVVREAFRLHYHDLSPQIEIIVFPRLTAMHPLTTPAILKDLSKLPSIEENIHSARPKSVDFGQRES